MKTRIVYGLLALLLLAACSRSAGPAGAVASTADVPRITPQELKAKLDAGEPVIVADARSAASYEASHIAGAISVPATGVQDHLDALPQDAQIVFYCT